MTSYSRAQASPRQSERISPAGRASDRWLGLLVGVGCGVQLVELPLNLSLVDALIVFIVAFAGAVWLKGSSLGWSILSRSLPWLWLVLIGSVSGLVFAADPAFGAVQLLRDFYAFAIFYAAFTWLSAKPHVSGPLANGLFAAASVCAGLILVSTELRPSGTFTNPNYAAHFVAGVTILMLYHARRRRFLLVLLPITILAILKTASFGAISMLAGAAIYFIWTAVSGQTWLVKVALRTSLIVVMIGVLTTGAVSSLSASERAEETGLSASRLDRSSDTRLEIWSTGLALVPSYPLGVGPGSVRNQDLALRDHELHNDPLAYLVERGAIGLLGLVGLVISLWKSFPPQGVARVLLFAFMIGSMTRETLNYRHLWILLAVALCTDLVARSSSAPKPRAELGS